MGVSGCEHPTEKLEYGLPVGTIAHLTAPGFGRYKVKVVENECKGIRAMYSLLLLEKLNPNGVICLCVGYIFPYSEMHSVFNWHLTEMEQKAEE